MSDLHNPTAFRVNSDRRLLLAIAASIALHGLTFGPDQWRSEPKSNDVAASQALEARLVAPPLPAAPVLIAPAASETLVARAAPAPGKPPPAEPMHSSIKAPNNTASLVTTAARQVSEHLFYPPEAIARGLQGEAQVLLFLDEAGNAIAARLERSSGHAILDEAALQAARAVRSAPDSTAREVLLPVRFRLN